METKYKIVFEQGKAKKPYNKMNEQEREEVSRVIWEEVKRKAAAAGHEPVTAYTIAKKK